MKTRARRARSRREMTDRLRGFDSLDSRSDSLEDEDEERCLETKKGEEEHDEGEVEQSDAVVHEERDDEREMGS